MLGKTHLAAGTAAALILLKPDTLPKLVLGVGVAAVGSIVCDMDSESSISRKKADAVTHFLIGMLVFLAIARIVFRVRIFHYIMQHSTISRILIGGLLFLVVCLYGKDKDHRTFMHSFAVMLVLSFCILLIVPGLIVYFVIGFASHLVLDLMNYQGLTLLWPLHMKFSLKLCTSDGIVNTVLLAAGTVAAAGMMILRAVQILS